MKISINYKVFIYPVM